MCTAAATSRRGRPWSRRRTGWATARSCSRRRTCAVTTSPTLQSVLARLGFDCGRVDGILGPTTTQRRRGLPTQLRSHAGRGLRTRDGSGARRARPPERIRPRRGGAPRVRGAVGIVPPARRPARRHRPVRRDELAHPPGHARVATARSDGHGDRRAGRPGPGRHGQPVRGHRLRRLRGPGRDRGHGVLLRGARRSSRRADARSPPDSYICSRNGSRASPSRPTGMRLPVLRETPDAGRAVRDRPGAST